jgi:octaprenyl-diphosphate synthase
VSEPAVHLAQLYPPLADYLAEVERHIVRLADADPATLQEAGRYVTSGRGKRLRPGVLLLAADACGAVGPRTLLHAAVVELMHTASLVHDDVVDEAAWRRGRLSAPARWDNKISVLLGDYLLARSFQNLTRPEDAPVVGELAAAAAQMCAGQVQEIVSGGPDLTEQEYLQIIATKTASLFASAARIGAMAGGPEAVEAFDRFGHEFGMAFQIADDILDVTGTSSDSGKPVRGDLKERKATLPAIFVLRTAPAEAQAQLRAALTNGKTAGHEQIEDLLRRHGGVDYAWAAAGRHLERARQSLAAVPASGARQALLAAAGDAFPLPVMASAGPSGDPA